jgi:hypothetical protein
MERIAMKRNETMNGKEKGKTSNTKNDLWLIWISDIL